MNYTTDIITIIGFIFGILFSFYILKHLKMVIGVKSWRASSISALGLSAFLFFAFSHPKVTKVVANLFGARLDLSSLNKEINSKRQALAVLDEKISIKEKEIISLKKEMDSVYLSKISKPLSESLARLQKQGTVVGVFPNLLAVNPKLALKHNKEIPEKFKDLPDDAWVVVPSEKYRSMFSRKSDHFRQTADLKSNGYIILSNNGNIIDEKISIHDEDFIQSLIHNEVKTQKSPNQ